MNPSQRDHESSSPLESGIAESATPQPDDTAEPREPQDRNAPESLFTALPPAGESASPVEAPEPMLQPGARTQAAARRGERAADRSGKTAFGLIIVWICMLLVVYANRESNAFIRLDSEFRGGLPLAHSQVSPGSLAPQVALQGPISLFQRDTTTRQMLNMLAGYLGFAFPEHELDKLGDAGEQVKSVRLEHTPVYSALHQVMNDSRFGIGLHGKDLLIFPQTLESVRGGGNVQEMKWESELELSPEALMIFPSADNGLWFKVRLANAPQAESTTDKPELEIEVWRGTEWLSMARVELDAAGTAQLTMSNVENSQFIVQRLTQDGAKSLYKLQFLKQSFSQAKSEP